MKRLPDPRPYFAEIEDPRCETRNKLHKLEDIAQGCAGAAKRMRPPWMAEGRATQEQLPRCARAAIVMMVLCAVLSDIKDWVGMDDSSRAGFARGAG